MEPITVALEGHHESEFSAVLGTARAVAFPHTMNPSSSAGKTRQSIFVREEMRHLSEVENPRPAFVIRHPNTQYAVLASQLDRLHTLKQDAQMFGVRFTSPSMKQQLRMPDAVPPHAEPALQPDLVHAKTMLPNPASRQCPSTG
jgi:hypothetical protein